MNNDNNNDTNVTNDINNMNNTIDDDNNYYRCPSIVRDFLL